MIVVYMIFALALFLILLSVLLFRFNSLYKKTNHYQNQFLDAHKFTDSQMPEHLQIINLGSNHPKYAFDYSTSNIRGMSWAVGPQSLEYDFQILKHYYSHIEKNGIVLIPICLLKIFLFRYKNQKSNYKYYQCLPPESIVEYSKKVIKHIKVPLLYHPKYFRYLLKDVQHDNRMELKINPMDEVALEKDGEAWIKKCWNPEFGIEIANLQLHSHNVDAIQKNIAILKDLIHFCIGLDLRPMIILLPVTKYLSKQFPDSFIQHQLLDYINQANDRDVPVLNYLKDERFTAPDLYINSFFMNKRGRLLFTETLIAEFKAKKIL